MITRFDAVSSPEHETQAERAICLDSVSPTYGEMFLEDVAHYLRRAALRPSDKPIAMACLRFVTSGPFLEPL